MELSRILIIVAIIVLLFFVIRYAVALNSNTISSLNDATSSVVIPATSLTTDSNGATSTNFTYSIWFYISDWSYRYGKNKVIFTRSASGSTTNTFNGAITKAGVKSCVSAHSATNPGCAINSDVPLVDVMKLNNNYRKTFCENTSYGCCPFSVIPKIDRTGTNCGLEGAALDPCPTMYLGATENDLFYQVSIPNPNSPSKNMFYTLGVKNIPIQRWVHSVMSIYDRTIEIYIDGKLARTAVMPNVMTNISTKGDVYLSPAEPKSNSQVGFSGYTSNLKYYPNPITPREVWNLYQAGPGTSLIGGSSNGVGGSNYSVKVSLYDGNVQKNSYTIGGDGLESNKQPY
jgi:hypothetical protein